MAIAINHAIFQQWITNTIKAGKEQLKLSDIEIRWCIAWILQQLELQEWLKEGTNARSNKGGTDSDASGSDSTGSRGG